MLSTVQLQMRLPILVSYQNAAPVKIWSIIWANMAVVFSIYSQVKESRMRQVRRVWVNP